MRRLNRQGGAVAVVVALLMVPLIGFAAISLDYASLWSKRQQLQTGADAGALAIAAACARQNCGTPTQTAQSMATANTNDGQATATVSPAGVLPSTGQVTVRTSAVQQNLFAPVLGFDSSAASASATVGWGAPSGGTAILPLTFSWCEFAAQTSGGIPSGTTTRTIFFTKDSGTTCTGPSNNVLPGGFGWITPDSGTCVATTSLDDVLWSSTGASVPSGCVGGDMAAQQNKVVLFPIFDDAGDSGSNAWYRIYGYAAFKLTGYNFPGNAYSWNPSGCTSPSRNCIKGYFTQFVDLSSAFDYSTDAPNLGGAVVRLTQ